jgi:hypothetical protein
MRATVNFEVDLERVSQVMLALVKAETDSIRSAAHVVETTTPEKLESDLDKAVGQLRKNLHQLEQYRSMLLSFTRAKFETMLPQPVPEAPTSPPPPLEEQLQSLGGFGDFMNRLEEGDDPEPQEG